MNKYLHAVREQSSLWIIKVTIVRIVYVSLERYPES